MLKLCCIFNIAPHYNEAIYKLIDETFRCDFYIGDSVGYEIELMDYTKLDGFVILLQNKFLIGHYYWQKYSVQLCFKKYTHYIISGEPYCVSTWLILILNWIMRKKTLLWSHGWYGDETYFKRVVKKIFFGLSFKVLLYGNYAKNLMVKEGFKQDKLITIYNSMDYKKQLEVRKLLRKTNVYTDHFSNKYPTLIYVGRIQKSKKLELLISAINFLNKQGISCNLVIIGSEVENTNIKELAKLYGLEKFVWFYGPCYDERILGEMIYNADLCAVPGNIGLTAMHSFVYGTPVITHDKFTKHGPEFEAIKGEITGDFFKENSVDDLCLKISKWISLPSDKRERVRIQCYEIINKNYNPHTQIETLKNVVEQR